jgi:diguanylate cyclase (GGDEF)-like protein/PAS domain S-box-containing protein
MYHRKQITISVALPIMISKAFNTLPLFWHQLLVYCLIALLPVMLLLPWLYHQSHQQLIQSKSEQLLLIAQEKFYQMQIHLQAQKEFVQQLANTPAIVEILLQSDIELFDQQTLRQTSNSFLQQHQHLNLFIINTNGKLLFAAQPHMALGENLASEEWKTSVLGDLYSQIIPKPMVFGYRWDNVEGKLTALVSAPIYYNNAIIGYLIIQLNKTWLNQFIVQRQGLGETGEINLGYQRPDGSAAPLFPTRFSEHNSAQRKALAGELIPLEKAIDGQVGWGESFDYRGEPIIAAWLYEPETNLGVVVKQDKKELFSALNTQKTTFIISFILLMLTVIGLTHRETRKQAKIIQQLADQAQRLGSTQGNNFNQTPEHMAPELKKLSEALSCADSQIKAQLSLLASQSQLLEHQAESLKNANIDLEAKIARKTAELNEYIKIVEDYVIISRTDLDGKITYASHAFCHVSGYNLSELIGLNHSIIKHPSSPDELFAELWQTIRAGNNWHGEIHNKRKDGSSFWLNTNISPTYDVDTGNMTGFLAIREDITDRKMAEHLSITDEMTQLYNRRHFNDKFDELRMLVASNKLLITLIMIDVDHFKNYNDSLGHHQGDTALVAVAGAIKSASRHATDYTFRLGGEEMGVLAIIQHTEEGLRLANRIQQEVNLLALPHPKSSVSQYVTISIGICFFDGKNAQIDSDYDLEKLYQLADKALYQAKNTGRNRIVCCKELDFIDTKAQ